MAGQRFAVALVLLMCYLALGQAFVLPILLKKLDLGVWPGFGYRYMPYQPTQSDYPQREIIQVFPQYPVAGMEGFKTGQ